MCRTFRTTIGAVTNASTARVSCSVGFGALDIIGDIAGSDALAVKTLVHFARIGRVSETRSPVGIGVRFLLTFAVVPHTLIGLL